MQGIKELNNVMTSQENRINTLETRLEKLEKKGLLIIVYNKE